MLTGTSLVPTLEPFPKELPQASVPAWFAAYKPQPHSVGTITHDGYTYVVVYDDLLYRPLKSLTVAPLPQEASPCVNAASPCRTFVESLTLSCRPWPSSASFFRQIQFEFSLMPKVPSPTTRVYPPRTQPQARDPPSPYAAALFLEASRASSAVSGCTFWAPGWYGQA